MPHCHREVHGGGPRCHRASGCFWTVTKNQREVREPARCHRCFDRLPRRVGMANGNCRATVISNETLNHQHACILGKEIQRACASECSAGSVGSRPGSVAAGTSKMSCVTCQPRSDAPARARSRSWRVCSGGNTGLAGRPMSDTVDQGPANRVATVESGAGPSLVCLSSIRECWQSGDSKTLLA